MSIYRAVPKNFESIAQRFKRTGENIKISKPVLLNGERYYGVIYKSFCMNTISGIIFIDDGGSIIDGDTLQELVEIFYYYNLLFDTSVVNLRSSLKCDDSIKKEESDYLEASRLLVMLSDEGTEGALEVKDVVDKIPSMKKDENDTLKALFNKVEEYESQDVIFSRDIVDELLPIYEKAVLLNFQSVKFINTASEYYYDIKKDLSSRGRKMKNIFNRGLQSASFNLESTLSFFQNVVQYYGNTVNLSDENYINNLRGTHADNIRKWRGKIR